MKESVTSYLPIEDPTLIFLVVLCIILFSPIVMGKLRIPHIVGLVLSGVAVGPYGLNILSHGESFRLFGNVGLYYILFLAGLEMDLEGLRRDARKVWLFGVLTFSVPWLLTFLTSHCLLHYRMTPSLILSCVMSSNTMIAYPIISRYGLGAHQSVRLSVGGSMLALFFSLVVLATIVSTYNGNAGIMEWLWFVVRMMLFFNVMFLLLPRITRWFLRRYSDAVMQFAFTLSMLFVSAALSSMIGLEGVLGAFLAGLIMGRYIPQTSPLMNRLEFTGNSLFIPFFLIGVGMLINCRMLMGNMALIVLMTAIVTVGTLGKAIAAYAACLRMKLPIVSGNMMFGLTSAHAAGAIAIVMVGTRLTSADGQAIVSDDMLNAVVLMILFTCIISTVATQRTAKSIVLKGKAAHATQTASLNKTTIMLPVKYPDAAQRLLEMAMLLQPRHNANPLVAVNIVYDDHRRQDNIEAGRALLLQLKRTAVSTNVDIQTYIRVDANIANGIKYAFKEHSASEIIIGIHANRDRTNSFWGQFAKSLYNGLTSQIMFVRLGQPINTIRMIQVAVPSRAEYEPGFYKWVERMGTMSKQLDCKMVFHATQPTSQLIRQYLDNRHPTARVSYQTMTSWSELPALAGKVNHDHLLVVVTARKDTVSYKSAQEKLPEELKHHYKGENIIILFPDQYGDDKELMTFAAPQHQEEESAYSILKKMLGRISPKCSQHN